VNIASAYRGPIRLLLLDVDGVLTDSTLFIGRNGEEFKSFNTRDGLAVALLRAHGIRTGVLSGKSSDALDFRIKQLGIDVAVTGHLDKASAFAQILSNEDLTAESVAYVGDDVVDLPLAGRVGRFYAPSDAHRLVLERADHVLNARGGGGAAREAAEHLLLTGGLTLLDAYAPMVEQLEALHASQ
jgi:3-deoxy-D-manno-octulosonate 8-phosphate phosphatase (KDO 8-P phosphatase)